VGGRVASCLGRPRCFLLLGAVLVALVGAGVTRWASQGGRPALRYGFVPGQRLIFDLEYLSVSAVDLDHLSDSRAAGSPGPSRSVHASAEGELAVTVLAVEDEQVRLAYRLHGPVVGLALDGQLQVALSEALQADLERGLFVQADGRGRIVSVQLSP